MKREARYMDLHTGLSLTTKQNRWGIVLLCSICFMLLSIFTVASITNMNHIYTTESPEQRHIQDMQYISNMLQNTPSVYTPASISENIRRFCADTTEGERDVCGITGPNSWQCLYAKLHHDIVYNKRPLTATVFECHGSRECGGLGDRLRGIVNTFYLSVSTGRGFFMNITKPTEFSRVLKPKGIYWDVDLILKDADVIYNTHTQKDSIHNKEYEEQEVLDSREKFIHTYTKEYEKVDTIYYIIQETHKLWEDISKYWIPSVPLLRISSNASLKNGIKDFRKALKTQKSASVYTHDTDTHKVFEALGTMKPGSVSVMIGCAINFLFQPSNLTNDLLTDIVVKDVLKLETVKTHTHTYTHTDTDTDTDTDAHIDTHTGIDTDTHTGTNAEMPYMLAGLHTLFNVPPKINKMKHASLSNFINFKFQQTEGEILAEHEQLVRNQMLHTFPYGTKLLGIHFRMRGQDGFGDLIQDSSPLNLFSDLDDLLNCAFRFADLLGWERDKFKILFASDNMRARIRAQSLHPDLIILKQMQNGQTFHIDQENVTDVTGLKTADTVVETILLSLADALIMSQSGFSFTAMSMGFFTKSETMHFMAHRYLRSCNINFVHDWGQKFT